MQQGGAFLNTKFIIMIKFLKAYAFTDENGNVYQVMAYNKKEAAKKIRNYHPGLMFKDNEVYLVK